MDYLNVGEHHLPDDLLESVVEEDKNGFDFTKLLTNAVQLNCNNNCSRTTDDIFAESIRAAFIVAEDEDEDHLNSNQLLSELSSSDSNWMTQLTNSDITSICSPKLSPESNEDVLEKLSNTLDQYVSEPSQITDHLPSISCSFLKTQTENLENILTKNHDDVLLSLVSSTEASNVFNVPVSRTDIMHGNNEANIISVAQHINISNSTNGEGFNNTGPFNVLPQERLDSNKKPKRKRAASDREKNRTQSVNSAFQKLRTLIPTEPVDRKLSKVETLRLAISYISHLGSTLDADVDDEQPCMRKYARYNWETENNVCTFCMSNTKTVHR